MNFKDAIDREQIESGKLRRSSWPNNTYAGNIWCGFSAYTSECYITKEEHLDGNIAIVGGLTLSDKQAEDWELVEVC